MAKPFYLTLWMSALLACTDYATIGRAPCPDCEADAARADAPELPANTSLGDAGSHCSSERQLLVREPSPLLLLVDLSSGLLASWLTLQTGLNGFLRDPASSELRVGLQVIASSCADSDYAALRVPIAPVSANLDAISSAVAMNSLETSSKLPALRGSVAAAQRWARDNSEGAVTMVVLTDGLAGPCDPLATYDDAVRQIVSDGYANTPTIQTYAIGIGELTSVDVLASAGGTVPYRISVVATDQEVVRALQSIVAQAASCTFSAPGAVAASAGMSVVASSPDGSQRTYTLSSTPRDCASTGFYTAADRVVACPEACSTLDTQTKLELEAGCQ